MKKINATSVSIHVYDGEVMFRFFDDVWEEDERGRRDLVHEEEVDRVTIPRSIGNEIAIYTGDNNEAYDYTEWFCARKPLPDGNSTLLHKMV